MPHVTSKDGTPIAYEKAGSGPALVLVDGAFCFRAFGPSGPFSKAFSDAFTVYRYDRRGRGESGDAKPTERAREIEDLEAVVAAAGGHALLVGLSSGAGLALEAAAAGIGRGVVAFEPPYMDGPSGNLHLAKDHRARLDAFVANGERSAAVKYFMRDMVDVPAFGVFMMRAMFWVWAGLAKVAHTLPNDALIMNDFRVPRDRLATIKVPTLVGYGDRTQARLVEAAKSVAQVVPGARLHVFPGQDHNIAAAAFAPPVRDFLRTIAGA